MTQVALVSDSELLLRIAARDRAAFDEFHRRFARPVLRLALRWLRDRLRAEDATQETFAAVWRSAGTYRPDRGPGAPWLYAVARNAIVNQTRARVETVAEVPESASNRPGPAEQAETDWMRLRVRRAVAELPGPHRVLIELAYWSGLSQSEIADRLDMPLGTVKTRTRAALAKLDELLGPDELR
jgi:RNA polymerase sigma-70 factor (ECF subfamily)